eukprot:154920_1
MFVWLLFASCIIFIANSAQTRIVGGSSVPAEDYPYIAALLWNDGSLHCGGSILTKESPSGAVILTAGHCVEGDVTSTHFVRLYASDFNGAYDETTNDYMDVSISHVIRHEDYDDDLGDNDIALIFITDDISSVTRLGTVSIAPLATADAEPFAASLEVVGYGADLYEGGLTLTLEAASVPYVTRANCRAQYPEETITNGMICAGSPGYDSCQGDSGGPLLTIDSNEQIGIVSWGDECAVKPGVYTNIGVYYDWIWGHIQTQDPTTVTLDPTQDPTRDPTQDPSQDPTQDPTQDPSQDPTQDPTQDPSQNPTTQDPTDAPSMPPSAYSSLWESGQPVRFKAKGCNNLCINLKNDGATNLEDCDTGSRVTWMLASNLGPMKFKIKNSEDTNKKLRRDSGLLNTNKKGHAFLIDYTEVSGVYYIEMRHANSNTCPQLGPPDHCDDDPLPMEPCSSISDSFNIEVLDIDASYVEPMPAPQPGLFVVDNYYNVTWLMIVFMAIVFVSWCCILMKTEDYKEYKRKEDEPKMLSDDDEEEDEHEPSGPRLIKLFANKPQLDFTDAEDIKAAQQVVLKKKHLKGDKMQLKALRFQRCTSVQIFFVDNQKETEYTFVNRIGIIGRLSKAYHTEYGGK